MGFSISNFPPDAQENIENRELLLEYYNLQGVAHQVFHRNLNWLIEKRLSSDLEKQAPWSDPITEFEGVATTLYGVTTLLERVDWNSGFIRKNLNIQELFKLIADDICFVYSGTRVVDEQKKKLKKFSASYLSRSKKNIQNIDTSLEPFVDS